jgi:hypothetical protein
MYAVSIGQENADIVQHSRLLQEGLVEVQLGMTVGNVEGFIGHLSTVCQKDMEQFALFLGILGIIFMDDFDRVHTYSILDILTKNSAILQNFAHTASKKSKKLLFL